MTARKRPERKVAGAKGTTAENRAQTALVELLRHLQASDRMRAWHAAHSLADCLVLLAWRDGRHERKHPMPDLAAALADLDPGRQPEAAPP